MTLTKDDHLNQLIQRLDAMVRRNFPKLIQTLQPGFRAINYGIKPGMKHVVFYIIGYDYHANLGFPHGVALTKNFPFLKGTGKKHRHISIDANLFLNLTQLEKLLQAAYESGMVLNKS